MKVTLLVILTVVILSGNAVSAQDIHDTAASWQRSADIEKQEDQSESESKHELLDSSVAEAVDNDADESPSLESEETDIDDDIDVEFEVEVEGHDPASEFYDPDDLESEGKDVHPAGDQPVTEFPPPFDHSTVDSSDVAQVAHFVLSMDS